MVKVSRGEAITLIESVLNDAMHTIREQDKAAMQAFGLCEDEIEAIIEQKDREFLEWRHETLTTFAFEVYGLTLADTPERSQ